MEDVRGDFICSYLTLFHWQLFHLHDCSAANPRTNGDKSVFIKISEIK